MAASLSYPGLYIEEVASGVRTITGVSTSVAAFIGRAKRGPVDKAVVINSYSDFERTFGGLALYSAMSFAVRDFFMNGGGQAVIVRLFHPGSESIESHIAKLTDFRSSAEPPADPPPADPAPTELDLAAVSPGEWGNKLKAVVDHDVDPNAAEQQGLEADDIFNLTITDEATGVMEQHRNISVKDGPKNIKNVLKNYSLFVRVNADLGTDLDRIRPSEGVFTVASSVLDKDGNRLISNSYIGDGFQNSKKGLYALEQADIFNLLCLPPDWEAPPPPSLPPPASDSPYYPGSLLSDAATYCKKRRALLLVDPDPRWNITRTLDAVKGGLANSSKNSALFFPRLKQPNPLRDNQVEEFAPCGVVAGIISRTDSQRGVWKAAAGLDATLVGVPELTIALTDGENGQLNQMGVNCLRSFPNVGRVIWGARTLQGADRLASEWKYIPVRRTSLFIQESLNRGLGWVVFEPNDEPLWASIRLNVGAFMQNLFRQGAFAGRSAREAYLVKCDAETTIQNDINLGVVNIVVGFAPLKPAEFVVIKIQQLAGQISV